MKRKAKRKATPKKKAARLKRTVRRAAKRLPARSTRVKGQRDEDVIEDLMVASAQALGLTIDPAWRKGVEFHLRLVLGHAARVDAFKLPDDAEPAPIFHA